MRPAGAPSQPALQLSTIEILHTPALTPKVPQGIIARGQVALASVQVRAASGQPLPFNLRPSALGPDIALYASCRLCMSQRQRHHGMRRRRPSAK